MQQQQQQLLLLQLVLLQTLSSVSMLVSSLGLLELLLHLGDSWMLGERDVCITFHTLAVYTATSEVRRIAASQTPRPNGSQVKCLSQKLQGAAAASLLGDSQTSTAS